MEDGYPFLLWHPADQGKQRLLKRPLLHRPPFDFLLKHYPNMQFFILSDIATRCQQSGDVVAIGPSWSRGSMPVLWQRVVALRWTCFAPTTDVQWCSNRSWLTRPQRHFLFEPWRFIR
jgi:hypothetical protein